jgi:hypothetical protein
VALLASACAILGGRQFSVQPNADRNILLVTIDTLRADALGSYGGRAATPNLDALAAHGARFTYGPVLRHLRERRMRRVFEVEPPWRRPTDTLESGYDPGRTRATSRR